METPPAAVAATYSAREAANVLGISQRTVYELAQAGALPHLRIGRSVRFPIDRLHAFIAEQTKGGQD